MVFHNCVAKLLFLTKRERPEIKISITFITTHVRSLCKYYQKNLNIVITYLNGMLDIPPTLKVDLATVVK